MTPVAVRVNDMMHLGLLAQCLAHTKHSSNINYYLKPYLQHLETEKNSAPWESGVCELL